jgi:hypothetical protein
VGFCTEISRYGEGFVILNYKFSVYLECGHSSFLAWVFYEGGEGNFQRVLVASIFGFLTTMPAVLRIIINLEFYCHKATL